MAKPTKVQKIAAINGMQKPALVAMLTSLGVDVVDTATVDELKAKAIEKSIGGSISLSFSGPIFNLVAAIVAIFMAGIPETQFWGAVLVTIVLIVDIIRTIKAAKTAGKTFKANWQEVLKDIQAEIWALVLAVVAVLVTDMFLLVFAAGILLVDSLTEVKKA